MNYNYRGHPYSSICIQRNMDTILQGIDGVVCYIYDTLIKGAAEEEHLKQLEEVLHCLEHDIKVLIINSCLSE